MNGRNKLRLAAPFVVTLAAVPACGGGPEPVHPNPPGPEVEHPNPPGPEPSATPSGAPTAEPPTPSPTPPK